MTDAYADWRKRLYNWGRYCRLNPDAPDSSCANPLYEMMVGRDEDDGYATDEDRALVNRVSPPLPEPDPIDEGDAEVIDAWVRQLWGAHRMTLTQHYVLRNKQPRECIDAAIRAIWDLQERNRMSNREMERGLR